MTTQDTILEREQKIIDEFALFDDWLGRYEYLIELGNELPLIEDTYKTEQYRIKGCQSQVWLRPDYREGRVYFRADSDAIITKGLIALLVRVLNGQRPENIAEAPLNFIDSIGMKEHLSSTRKNGLASMIRQIKDYARSICVAHHDGADRDGLVGSGSDHAVSEPPDAQVGSVVTEEDVVEGIRTVFDPEIPVNVYDLGLIYEIAINPDNSVFVLMTLTAPNCPAAGFLPGQVEAAVRSVEGVTDVRVDVTFTPPFTMDMMSDEARLELGLL